MKETAQVLRTYEMEEVLTEKLRRKEITHKQADKLVSKLDEWDDYEDELIDAGILEVGEDIISEQF